MEKVKFTLGLALVMLFTGANFVNAELVERDNTIKRDGDTIFTHQIDVDYTIQASPSYANNRAVKDFTTGSVNSAIIQGVYARYMNAQTNKNLGVPSQPISGGMARDIRLSKLDYDLADSWLTYTYLDSAIRAYRQDTVELYYYATVKLGYANGLDITPFVKCTVVYGKWMYDTDKKEHVMVPTHSIPYNIEAYEKTKRTDHTYGTDTATFKYKTNILDIIDRTPLVYSIHFDIWTNDMFGGDDEGPAFGDKYTNYAIVINAAPGIATNPGTDIITPKYVRMGTSFTFDVSGDPGKELEVTSSDYLWTADNGGIVITPVGAGKWKVTLYRVSSSMTVKIGYKTVVESGETGNGAFAADAVWGSGGTLYVKAATPGTLSVYSVTGQLCKQASISGDFTATLPKGLYIVQLNGKAYKVVL